MAIPELTVEESVAALAAAIERRVLAAAPVPQTVTPALMSIAECGAYLHASRHSVLNLISRGTLKSVKVGRNRRVTVESVEAIVSGR